jgi:hypothetical protein
VLSGSATDVSSRASGSNARYAGHRDYRRGLGARDNLTSYTCSANYTSYENKHRRVMNRDHSCDELYRVVSYQITSEAEVRIGACHTPTWNGMTNTIRVKHVMGERYTWKGTAYTSFPLDL